MSANAHVHYYPLFNCKKGIKVINCAENFHLYNIMYHWYWPRIHRVCQRYITIICRWEWIVPQFLNLRPKIAKFIVYVITLITNSNHAFHCLN